MYKSSGAEVLKFIVFIKSIVNTIHNINNLSKAIRNKAI